MGILKQMNFNSWLDFFGFLSQILYDLSPILYIIFLKSDKLEKESVSCVAILGLYFTALTYFFLNVFNGNDNDEDIVSRDYCNLIGLYVGIIYLGFYFHKIYFDTNKKFFIIISLSILLSSGGIILIEYLAKESNYNDEFLKALDWIGVIFNVMEYFPMGFNIIYFLKNKCSEKIMAITAFFALINTLIWISWGIYSTINDSPKYHSILANFTGICLSILQFIIIFKYEKEKKLRVSRLNEESFDSLRLDSEVKSLEDEEKEGSRE